MRLASDHRIYIAPLAYHVHKFKLRATQRTNILCPPLRRTLGVTGQ